MRNSTPSSSSSSSFSHEWTNYDVFISFRGKDTRSGFISHLYEALCEKGINTFKDDRRIEIGEEITPALHKAIRESKIAIVVFSKNYASSVFCLDELTKIIECSNDKDVGMLVWPVFYEVEPSDVRYHKKSYAEALAKHEAKMTDQEKIKKWKSALEKAANVSGMHFKHQSTEYELIENITHEVSKKIHLHSHVVECPVGLKIPVQKVKSLLNVESNDGVHVVGIYGIGGSGKTTLARVVCNSIAYKFKRVCFLDDIRENLMKHGLLQIRYKLLCELVGEAHFEKWNGENDIPTRIKRILRRKKVLLILDDIDRLDQLKTLLMLDNVDKLKQFGSGSRIIITTRVQHLLQEFGVERTYKVEPLNRDEILELFSWNAFKAKEVNRSYKEVSEMVIRYSNGLPLSVKMIGLGFRAAMLSKEQISSDLFDKTVAECNSALDTYERIPQGNIKKSGNEDNINHNVDDKVRLEEEKELMREQKAEANLNKIHIKDGGDILHHDWHIKLSHILREGNSCADFLAKHGASNAHEITIFDSPHHELTSMLLADAMEVSFSSDEVSDLIKRSSSVPDFHLSDLITLKITFHHVTKYEVTIKLPKQSTVEDVIYVLKSKLNLSHPGAELRLLGIYSHMIIKIFSLDEKIDIINDQHCFFTVRAEKILEEEKNLGSHDWLINVLHFQYHVRGGMWNFGDPFLLVIHEGETLTNLKLRIQKKFQVPDEEFSKWKFASVRNYHAEYLKDSDTVSTWFKKKSINGTWEQYLGLEHADDAL